MLYCDNARIRDHLFEGGFGLELESLRVTEDGSFSHTAHPFPGDSHIVRDFCENQTEINTEIHDQPEGAVSELRQHQLRMYQVLNRLPEKEYLWPFSNPPRIKGEDDIPIAVFDKPDFSKTVYRQYLSEKYGRYKMTFSGIHVNFNFSDRLLEENYRIFIEKSLGTGQKSPEPPSFQEYKDRLYLDLAAGLLEYGWILVTLTAASPLLDSSFVETDNNRRRTLFTGMASVRCSELGYWNPFVPVLDYADTKAYARSILKYVEEGLLYAPSELYYPIRLKPHGENTLQNLSERGINHIELRMYDLNPLTQCGIDARDIRFAQLLMIWIASNPAGPFSVPDQIRTINNYKRAAAYDLDTVKILSGDGSAWPLRKAGCSLIDQMMKFYEGFPQQTAEILAFERQKLSDPSTRYAAVIREAYEDGFAEKALKLAKSRQEI